MGIPLKADAEIDGVADMVSGEPLVGRLAAWRIARRGMAMVVIAQADAPPVLASVALDACDCIIPATATQSPRREVAGCPSPTCS